MGLLAKRFASGAIQSATAGLERVRPRVQTQSQVKPRSNEWDALVQRILDPASSSSFAQHIRQRGHTYTHGRNRPSKCERFQDKETIMREIRRDIRSGRRTMSVKQQMPPQRRLEARRSHLEHELDCKMNSKALLETSDDSLRTPLRAPSPDIGGWNDNIDVTLLFTPQYTESASSSPDNWRRPGSYALSIPENSRPKVGDSIISSTSSRRPGSSLSILPADQLRRPNSSLSLSPDMRVTRGQPSFDSGFQSTSPDYFTGFASSRVASPENIRVARNEPSLDISFDFSSFSSSANSPSPCAVRDSFPKACGSIIPRAQSKDSLQLASSEFRDEESHAKLKTIHGITPKLTSTMEVDGVYSCERKSQEFSANSQSRPGLSPLAQSYHQRSTRNLNSKKEFFTLSKSVVNISLDGTTNNSHPLQSVSDSIIASPNNVATYQASEYPHRVAPLPVKSRTLLPNPSRMAQHRGFRFESKNTSSVASFKIKSDGSVHKSFRSGSLGVDRLFYTNTTHDESRKANISALLSTGSVEAARARKLVLNRIKSQRSFSKSL